LQTVIEEQEDSVQDLTTAHEELLSTNEELQSSNEELETAKEELQSGNEELTTVNEELRKRNEELDRLTGELGKLIAGVEIPIVNLDRQRSVVRFSPAAKAAFHLIDSDVGRPFDHIKAPFFGAPLDELIKQALSEGDVIVREVQDKSGRWQLLRIRAYREGTQETQGVLIALVDIDTIKRRAAAIVESINQPLMVLDAHLRVLSVNPAFCRAFRVSAHESEGVLLFKLGRSRWNIPELHTLLKEILPKQQHFDGFRVEHDFVAIGRKVFLLSARQVFDEGVGTDTVLLLFEDVTDREAAARELRALGNRLRQEKEQSERRLAHELHDLSSQGFASLGIDLARLATLVGSAPGEVEQGLRALGARVSALAHSTHELARRLHPSVLDDLGLEKALEAECRAFEEHTAIAVKYHAEALPERLPEAVELCLYRICQEALRNVAGHAKAKRVEVTLRATRKRMSLVVYDTGVGFNSAAARAKGGLGLVGIAERAAAVGGSAAVNSKPGAGTTVKVTIPLHGDK
jgi:two-component system CheB/CheR fusion protein